MAVARVKARVRAGGHAIPEDTIRRRYRRGIVNFLELYRSLVDSWRVYDNSGNQGPRLIASGDIRSQMVVDEKTWQDFQACAKDD